MREEPHSPVSFVANVAHLPQKGMTVVVVADPKQRWPLNTACCQLKSTAPICWLHRGSATA